ncbi:MAG: dihydropteroate synthase [Planctomycetota bacterium]|nr:dihydropteroate synthase [Planctomycetota bacterium]
MLQPRWRIARGHSLAVGVHDPALVMGILNVTPDSFSDGGLWMDPEVAVDRALEMISEGASIIDIGGESTRPGAARVEVAEQIRRVVPLITALSRRSDVAISVDTTRVEVAEAALDAGASIVNDVSSGDDGEMFELVARRGCGVVLMHRLCDPSNDSYSDRYSNPPQYDDVVHSVRDWLDARTQTAQSAGIDASAMCIDPGFGFGKTVEQNGALLERLNEIVALGFPTLVSISRKSFVGAIHGIVHPNERDFESARMAARAVEQGSRIVRAHAVQLHIAHTRARCLDSTTT